MPVIGYRSWTARQTARGVVLSSLGVTSDWNAVGVTTAKCKCNGARHEVASQEGECGLYVLSTLVQVPAWHRSTAVDPIIGAVMGWGRVVQHGDEGWRAQFARPIAFLDNQVITENPLLDKLCQQYGVPLLNRKGIELLVKEHGSPLPKEVA